MTTQTVYFPLQGGLNLVTPAIQTPPGHVIAGVNYEPHPRGYQRLQGFERFDGQPKPSEASYWVLSFTDGNTAVAEDDIVTGASSGATARALIAGVVESGSYGGSDAAGYLVLTNLSGEFQDGETLQVSASSVALADGTESARGALNDTDENTWLQAAIEKARDDIAAVPGSGSVRGVWVFGGEKYAFRDNAGGTAGVMWKATATGWQAVDLGKQISFSKARGEYEPIDDIGSEPDSVPDIAALKDAINNGATVSEEASVAGMTFDGSAWLDPGTILPEVNYLFAETGDDAAAWTVDARFRVTSVSGTHTIVMRGGGTGTASNFAVWVDASGNLQCRLRGGTTTQISSGVDDGNWHSVSVSWDGTQALGYLDGGTGVTLNVGTATLQSGDPIYNFGIGSRADGGAGFGFIGQISNVRVWSYARSAAEISADYARRLNGNESGLVHYWPMSLIVGEFEEGQTVTGGTYGGTATIQRVVLESGSFSTQDGVGRLILSDVVNGFESGETLTTTTARAVASETIAAASPGLGDITLPAGGRYSFYNHNFFGSSDLKRMYGCQGEGTGFEFDGSIFVPIKTGMEDDRPIRVAVHRNHLFFAFRGGSLQHSSTGDPYEWQVLTGAGEIGIGEEITDLLPAVSGALSIFGRNKVAVLIGDDAANWQLRTLSDNAGAEPWTAQAIGVPVYLDNRGLRTLETTDQFGDFVVGTITQMVEPIFRSKRTAGVKAAGSVRVRSKDQYRLFWDDGTGLTLYFGREAVEVLPFDLDLTITCTASGKEDDGDETLLVGSSDGFVYELDAGTSFDGQEVPAFLRLPFNNVGSPAQRKRWQKATLELDGGRPGTVVGMTAEYSYADPDQPPSQEQQFTIKGGGGFWDEMIWDDFYWSSPVEGQAEAYIDGIGRNVSITVISNSVYEDPHVLQGMILYFSYRGLAR